MFNTVVWATDGSEDAIRALPYAKALATGEGAMLLVVHIVQKPGNATAEGGSPVDGGQSGFHPNVRELLADLSQQGLNAILKVVDFVGPQPAQRIADIAAEVDADVIVVGTRGHSAIGGLLAGSVTQHLLHVAPCPVLAVRPPLTQRNDAEVGVNSAHARG